MNEEFSKSGISDLIDNYLGHRVKLFGFQYSDIFMSGSEVIEDLNTHFGEHLKNIPNNKVPSSITTIRGINKLTVENTVFTPDSNISYNFNINKKMNHLNIKALLFTNQLKQGESYDLDYNNKIIENSNYDAKKTYKKNRG